jgi:hypothetical protein
MGVDTIRGGLTWRRRSHDDKRIGRIRVHAVERCHRVAALRKVGWRVTSSTFSDPIWTARLSPIAPQRCARTAEPGGACRVATASGSTIGGWQHKDGLDLAQAQLLPIAGSRLFFEDARVKRLSDGLSGRDCEICWPTDVPRRTGLPRRFPPLTSHAQRCASARQCRCAGRRTRKP